MPPIDNQSLALVNALLLGIRHGADWDHVAAIFDLTSGAAFAESFALPAGVKTRSVFLSIFYSFGHACSVVALGLAVQCFATLLPEWFDSAMQRIVGFTLVLFALWLIAGIGKRMLVRQSLAYVPQTKAVLIGKIGRWFGFRFNCVSPRGATALGIIHGAGAETATQLALIAAIGSGTSIFTTLAMLGMFVLGLMGCNAAIALVASIGHLRVEHFQPLSMILSAGTAAFSLLVGVNFLCGGSVN